jgi:hypothetical protein
MGEVTDFGSGVDLQGQHGKLAVAVNDDAKAPHTTETPCGQSGL